MHAEAEVVARDEAIELSEDHKPELASEERRIRCLKS